MKRYNSFERNKPFSLGERLSRLLTFDFRAQFAIEGGLDACLSLVVFGHGLTLGFTRGVPHVIAGVYLGVSALTEQFDMTFGFQSDWYDEYLNRLVDEIRPCTATADISSMYKAGIDPALPDADTAFAAVTVPSPCSFSRHLETGCDSTCAGRR